VGLGHDMVEAIFREHSFSPITGDVLLIGRQTVYFTPEELLVLAREHGIGLDAQVEDIAIDTTTQDRRSVYADKDLVADTAIFKLCGNQRVRALDHTHYEGAEVVHNLNLPLPEELKGIADFIVDGSTLDNVFSPNLALRNLAEMLRPGGRLLMINQWSNHHNPYVLVSPLWLLDYFAINKFVDCKVYLIVYLPPSGTNIFTVNLEWLLDPTRSMGTFAWPSPCEVGTIVLAEKGPESTTEATPTQQHYRSKEDWPAYRRVINNFRIHPRPHVLRSRGEMAFEDVVGGHWFVTGDYSTIEPGDRAELVMKMREAERMLREADAIREAAVREADAIREAAGREADSIRESRGPRGTVRSLEPGQARDPVND
jgi:hypothetical protein